MLTILSMIIGLAGSILPELLKKWQDASDKKQEVEIMKLQMEMAEKGHLYKMDEIGVEAYSEMVQSAHKDQAKQIERASRWVVNMSASVRPLVTFYLLVLFTAFKYLEFQAMITHPLPWQTATDIFTALSTIWGEEENAGFWGVIMYWFGDRALAKGRAGKSA